MKKIILIFGIILGYSSGILSQVLSGLDVSNYQGLINWPQVYGAGYTFAWAKATEGLNFTDAQYLNNAVNGPAAGIYMGAYHFAHPDLNPTNADAIAEANYFLSVAGPYIKSCALPPALDLEVSTSLTSAQLTSWVQNWMNTVQSATGIVPVLYTDGSIANSLGSSLASYCKLWIADPDGSPTVAPSSTYLGVWYPNWWFKQYSWNGTVPGITGAVDLDSYNGTLSSLQSLMVCTPPVCHHYYATLPYATSFENTWIIDSCSSNAERLPDIYWNSGIGGTTPNGNDYWHRNDYTGADWTLTANGAYTPTASNGNYSARFHNDPPPAGSQGFLDLYLNLSNPGAKQISFDYIHNESAASPFSFDVLLSTDSGHTFPITLYSITTAQIATWTTQTFTTSANSAKSVMRFIATDKGVQDVGIDNLKIRQIGDTIAPTTAVNVTGTWQTRNFTASFMDADNSGGSGLEKSFYHAAYFDGTNWSSNESHGFFTDDFTTSMSPAWTSLTGTWSINTNALYQSDSLLSNTNIYAPLTQNLSNRYLYHFNAKIGGLGSNRRAGLHIFCDQPDSSNRNNSYFVWFRVDQSRMEIYKVINNVFGNPVYSTAVTINANQYYDYIVVYDRISGLMRVYQNNVLIGSWTDSSPLTNGGYISFRTGNATLYVDQIRVFRSRTSAVTVSVGNGSANDLEYQNPNPAIAAGMVSSVNSDSAANLSSFVTQNINVDWTKPDRFTFVHNGLSTVADSVCSGTTQLSANFSTAVDSNSAVSYYEYAIGTTPGAQNVVGWTNNGNSTTVTSTGLTLTMGQHYYFTVKAVDGAGLACDSVNGLGVLVISCTTGINTLGGGTSVIMYPNPSRGSFIVEFPASGSNTVIRLVDQLGREVVHKVAAAGSSSAAFDQVGEGVYYLLIQTGSGAISTGKIIVLR